ncbi:hypothetical protein ISF_05198 [Cordyceps fumosorosea ARSEF 2679]|uniref:Uncharacterized protein n=1 Tax=Cordyceps fumosorosea (strain ARSEF 2679) TaxID=1081104 RepID=A0A162MKZ0_CORFA|nr:hypothetical protein ISF_05198 [Cordyceps fumosorosea ARSEF 2679]OAA62189.1 hypothetical protein ISF_05198 [Cordyceps fumosorosea ARSEF 2679]
MVLGLLVALAAGVAICHSCHKRHQRVDAFRHEYEAHNGAPLTKAEWKQLCREHKQALKAAKHAHKEEKRMRRHGCWRTSVPASFPAPAPGMDVKHSYEEAPMDYNAAPRLSDKAIQIPVQGSDEPPAYVPGSMAPPPEKM